MTRMIDQSTVTAPEAEAPPRRRARAPQAARPSRGERAATGKTARELVPLDAHAHLDLGGRADPVALLESQAGSRVPELVPIRYGRMVATPFTFYRGAALIMAADLARSPNTGLQVQLCGDAHLSNFGVFATPERHLAFDVNDFDETHPGPFEWDVKRLAASLAVAGRGNGYSSKKRRKVVLAAVAAYREAMTAFAGQNNLAVWYAHVDMDEVMRTIGHQLDHKQKKKTRAALDKAHSRDSVQALKKLTRNVDGRTRLLSQPPLLVPLEELGTEAQAEQWLETLALGGQVLSSDAPVAPAPPARRLPARAGGPQGCRRRKRGDARLDPALRRH